MTFEEQVKAAKKGDDDAFYELILMNKQKLYSIAYCYFRNEHDTLEAMQEVTCRAYLKLNSLKEETYFSSWLCKIAINYCINELKRKKKVLFIWDKSTAKDEKGLALEEEASEEDKAFSEDSNALDSSLDRLLIEEAISKIENKYKSVIVLKYFQDMTTQEIARTLALPEGTVKTWLRRGLGQLKEILNKEGVYSAR